MDDKFRIGGKISIADIFILICVVVLFYILYLLSAPSEVNADGAVNKDFMVEINTVKPGFVDNVEIGSTVYDSIQGSEIGTIVDAYETPYEAIVGDYDEDDFDIATTDDLVNCNIVIEAPITTNASNSQVGSYDVMVGNEIFIKTKDFAGAGYVVYLER